ncbi:MAG: hypothetical protein ACP59X_00510 [Solidesulfovibrio sp. DCME]
MAKNARPILDDQLATVSGWRLEVEDSGDCLRALFSRLTAGARGG